MEITLQLNLLVLDIFPVLFCLRGSNIFPNTNKIICFFTSKDNNKYMLKQFIALKILWMRNIWKLIKITLCPLMPLGTFSVTFLLSVNLREFRY